MTKIQHIDEGREDLTILAEQYSAMMDSLTINWPDLSGLPVVAQAAFVTLRDNQIKSMKAIKALHGNIQELQK